MIFAKRFILDVWKVSEHASAIYSTISIRRLPIRNVGYLFTKFIDIFHRASTSVVHGQTNVSLCSTDLLNNENYSTCFLTTYFSRWVSING